MSTICPCRVKENKSLKIYSDCCEPFHLAKAIPSTPEQLMRSRYSAYFYALGQYIHDTHHADYRGDTMPEEFTQSAKATRWCGLEVVSSEQDGVTATVEFKASFIDTDKMYTLHEISNFVLENDQWLYTDGDFQPRTSHKINRNQLCPCGSTKKAKRCCLQ